MDDGSFIAVINPSQTGKSMLMAALEDELKTNYMVINMTLRNITSGSLFKNFVSELETVLEKVQNKKITIEEDSLYKIFKARNTDKYFCGKKVVLIVDKIQEIQNAGVEERTRFLQSWRTCRERRNFQALQSSIIVSNYLGGYLHSNAGSSLNFPRFVPEYFSIEQVQELFDDYDKDYEVHTADSIVRLIHKESSGAPGLVQLFGGLYHSERTKVSSSHEMNFSEWSSYFHSSHCLNAVLSNANYSKILDFLTRNKNLSLIVARSIIKGSLTATQMGDIDILMQHNILKAHPAGSGYTMANPFISRLFEKRKLEKSTTIKHLSSRSKSETVLQQYFMELGFLLL